MFTESNKTKTTFALTHFHLTLPISTVKLFSLGCYKVQNVLLNLKFVQAKISQIN